MQPSTSLAPSRLRCPGYASSMARAPGPAAARNAGVRASDDGYILCCGPRTTLCSAWVRSMSTALAQADLVGGRVDDAELNAGAIRNAHVNYFEDALHLPADYLPYTPSCNVGFRRSVFDALDGFDETLTIAAEDVDFCWQAHRSRACARVRSRGCRALPISPVAGRLGSAVLPVPRSASLRCTHGASSSAGCLLRVGPGSGGR